MTMITNNHYIRALTILVAALAAGLVALAGVTKPAEAAFPGNNGKIVFESNWQDGYMCEGPFNSGDCTIVHDYPEVDNPGGDYEIFSINPDGTGLKQLTKNDKQDRNPAVSADGLRIAFEREENQSTDEREIYWMKADGSNQTRLTNVSEEGDAYDPTFSPDSQKIAYTSRGDEASNPERDIEIYQMIAFPGSAKHNLTDNATADGSPAYAPDGQKIAFDHSNEVYVMNSDGTSPTRLTNASEPSEQNFGPVWSPDGKKIAFTNAHSTSSSQHDIEWEVQIFTMNANGTNQVNVSNHIGAWDAYPAFSPDGNKIAFTKGADIYTMNATDGSNQTKVTNTPEGYANMTSTVQPDWQPISAPKPPTAPKCTIIGTERGDVIKGTSGDDVICGKGGNDQINGGLGNDTIYGGDSCSYLCAGNDGDDTLFGGEGNDKLDAKDGKGNDTLDGQGGWDECLADSRDSKASCEGSMLTNSIKSSNPE